jgi:hypothetical protein
MLEAASTWRLSSMGSGRNNNYCKGVTHGLATWPMEMTKAGVLAVFSSNNETEFDRLHGNK